MHLKSLTMKGFKSFPDRVRLDFGPGVSVVVGPNGSGKSNVTDAVLWAMGEQSPLAVRGQSMQDVIFGGGRGVTARSSAEVEIVLDNSDGTVGLPLSEISIVRRLDRSGEGEYRLNGARCRLVDVLEVLSDTGLGKESHSVISQGRVEAIVTSRPRDRRMLIEEAAGLGKHRKRRRRAQLKLEHTQENLDRALDMEREARARLRPLKRQAEAAELHARLERQMLEVRLALGRESVRDSRGELVAAEAQVAQARGERDAAERSLGEVAERRARAEQALSERVSEREALARRAYGARGAGERLGLRLEQARAARERLEVRIRGARSDLSTLNELLEEVDAGESSPAGGDQIAALESELAELEGERERELEGELEQLEEERGRARGQLDSARAEALQARGARERAESVCEGARGELREAERAVEAARREAARVGAELAAVNQFLRSHAGSRPAPSRAQPGGRTRPGTGGQVGEEDEGRLCDLLEVRPGYELALAAALGGRLDAAVAGDLARAEQILDHAGPDGAVALLSGSASPASRDPAGPPPGAGADGAGTHPGAGADGSSPASAREGAAGSPPVAGAERLLDLVKVPAALAGLTLGLLARAWVVERLEELTEDFDGVAVTRAGRVLFAATGEVRQLAEGGSERVLARRNERERLIGESERAVGAEQSALAAAEGARESLRESESAREEAERELRGHERAETEAGEALRRAGWLIDQRRAAPEQGRLAVRRAQLEGELAAERRQAERVARERSERLARAARLRARVSFDEALLPRAESLALALEGAVEATAGRVSELEEALSRDRAAGEEMSRELSRCAASEAEIQGRLRVAGERVTTAEVAAQRLRDRAADAEQELAEVAERLGLESREGGEPGESGEPEPLESGEPEPGEGGEPEPGEGGEPGPLEGGEPEPLVPEEIEQLRLRLGRLERRREQLGPVNPLARDEYVQALAHVEELEARRGDLETALRELRGFIRDTDRQIREVFQETFAAASRNFSELVADVFPGGSGRLALVSERMSPRAVIGGQEAGPDGEAEAERAAELESERQERDPDDLDAAVADEGVEIEMTPAGKSTKRLTLLSGGEKSMTALAFLFAVFLARPCPFYILDEVEAALDDLNLDRFLGLLRRYSGRAQFIVITHQQRTMEAADWLYGVSMGGDGVSKILSRRLAAGSEETTAAEAA